MRGRRGETREKRPQRVVPTKKNLKQAASRPGSQDCSSLDRRPKALPPVLTARCGLPGRAARLQGAALAHWRSPRDAPPAVDPPPSQCCRSKPWPGASPQGFRCVYSAGPRHTPHRCHAPAQSKMDLPLVMPARRPPSTHSAPAAAGGMTCKPATQPLLKPRQVNKRVAHDIRIDSRAQPAATWRQMVGGALRAPTTSSP